MTEIEDRTARGEAGVERLMLFTDAVVAILITLMVLEVKVPQLGHHASNAEVWQALLDGWPRYLAVGVSFFVVGTFWVAHHRRFGIVRVLTPGIIWLNLLFLLALAMVPFFTALLAEYPNRTSTIVYALNISVVSVLLGTLWWVVGRTPSVRDNPQAALEIRDSLFGSAVTVSIFLLSITIAFVDPAWARFSWLLLIGANWVARKLTPQSE